MTAGADRFSARRYVSLFMVHCNPRMDRVSNVFFTENLVRIGASFDDTTLELRFRTAMDSVGAGFPARTFTRDNVGILPINAELYLR